MTRYLEQTIAQCIFATIFVVTILFFALPANASTDTNTCVERRGGDGTEAVCLRGTFLHVPTNLYLSVQAFNDNIVFLKTNGGTKDGKQSIRIKKGDNISIFTKGAGNIIVRYEGRNGKTALLHILSKDILISPAPVDYSIYTPEFASPSTTKPTVFSPVSAMGCKHITLKKDGEYRVCNGHNVLYEPANIKMNIAAITGRKIFVRSNASFADGQTFATIKQGETKRIFTKGAGYMELTYVEREKNSAVLSVVFVEKSDILDHAKSITDFTPEIILEKSDTSVSIDPANEQEEMLEDDNIVSCGDSKGVDGMYSGCVYDTIYHETTSSTITFRAIDRKKVFLYIKGESGIGFVRVSLGESSQVKLADDVVLTFKYTKWTKKHGAVIQVTAE